MTGLLPSMSLLQRISHFLKFLQTGSPPSNAFTHSWTATDEPAASCSTLCSSDLGIPLRLSINGSDRNTSMPCERQMPEIWGLLESSLHVRFSTRSTNSSFPQWPDQLNLFHLRHWPIKRSRRGRCRR